MPQLTQQFIESIKPHPEKAQTHWDSQLKGFGVVVLPSGRCTYCIQYRNQDRVVRRYKIGVHGHIMAEEARSLAHQKLKQVVYGEDPAEEKKMILNLASIEDLAKNYLESQSCCKSPENLQKEQQILQTIILPTLGWIKVRNITREDIEVLHAKLQKTPYQANRVLVLLSQMFSLAIFWRWRANNPTIGIEKYSEEKPESSLSEEELSRLWVVLESHSDQLVAWLLKFLILTGARKSEILQATWDQFDLEKGIWKKPSHLTKQKKKVNLPLSEKAIEVLQVVKKQIPKGSSYVFPGRTEGEPLKEITIFWKTVLKEAGIENIRIHDLRDIHVSLLVSSGSNLSIVGKSHTAKFLRFRNMLT